MKQHVRVVCDKSTRIKLIFPYGCLSLSIQKDFERAGTQIYKGLQHSDQKVADPFIITTIVLDQSFSI